MNLQLSYSDVSKDSYSTYVTFCSHVEVILKTSVELQQQTNLRANLPDMNACHLNHPSENHRSHLDSRKGMRKQEQDLRGH